VGKTDSAVGRTPRGRAGAGSDLTRDELINLIRKADDLDSLKRMVGPSVDDETAARLRRMAIDMLFQRHGNDTVTWPQAALDVLETFRRQEAEYLRVYGGHAAGSMVGDAPSNRHVG